MSNKIERCRALGQSNNKEALFYMVSTPIGHLDDITLRALQTLQKVDYIACEDTRHTKKLLNHYKIDKPLLACHEHNERASAVGIIKLLNEGYRVAYCSDAGTPALSDPGGRLVQSIVEAGLAVAPIPGVSALATLISVSGFFNTEVLFNGFLPPKGLKRERRLDELLLLPYGFVLYESPYRLESLLQMLASKAPERELVVGREMTKLYEEFWRGTAKTVYEELGQQKILGEFAIYVAADDKKRDKIKKD